MARALDRFRKYEKHFMALLAVLCMIAFVFFDPSCGSADRSAMQSETGTVAEIRGRALRASHLERMIRDRHVANLFLQELIGVPQAFGPPDEQGMIESYVMELKARDLGVVVSEAAISTFVRQVAPEATNEMIVAFQRRQGVSPEELQRALRRELTVQMAYQLLFSSGAPPRREQAAAPSQLWDYYQRLHRQVAIEVLPVHVADFVDDVPPPPEANLQELLRSYSRVPPDPTSPTPGFYQVRRIAVEYLFGDYGQRYDTILAQITEQEARAHYDSLTDAQKESLYPYDPERPADPPADEPPLEAPPPSRIDNQPSPAGDAQPPPPRPENPVPAPPPAPQGGAGDPPPLEAPRASGRSAVPEPLLLASAELSAADDAAAAAGDEPVAPSGSSSSASQAGGDAPSSSSPTAPGEEPLEAPPPGGRTVGTPPADASRPLATIAAENRIPQSILDGPNPKFMPFWRVVDDVRKSMARQRAGEQLDAAVQAVRAEMDAYYRLYHDFRTLYADAGQSPPAPPDLKRLAEAHGLVWHAPQRLRSSREFAEQPGLGTSSVTSLGAGRVPIGQAAFSDTLAVYQPAVAVDADNHRYLFWKVKEIRDFEPQSLVGAYTEALTDWTESEIRQLFPQAWIDSPEKLQAVIDRKDTIVRDQVEHAWRMLEARRLAQNRAEAIRDEAQRDKKPLTQMTENSRPGTLLAPFTWLVRGVPELQQEAMRQLQQGNIQQALELMEFARSGVRINQPQGLEFPGHAFMRAVYALQPGELAVAFNQPQSVMYVVRLTDSQWIGSLGERISEETARARFVSEPMDNYRFLLSDELSELRRRWLNTIFAEYQVRMLR
jgi:hypothetical protein